LVIAEIVLTVLVIPIAILDSLLLPRTLQEYYHKSFETFRILDVLLLGIALPILALMIVAWVALLRGWRSGRLLYTIVWAAYVPILLLAGPGIQSPLYAIFDTASNLLGGIILGFLYFSGIRHFYRPKS
jgi:putative Mn2+ efflux pump MntP